jgi:signal peptidase I
MKMSTSLRLRASCQKPGMTALEAAEAAADPWTAFRMRVAVLVQFGCFLYILNNYGLSSTLCQGPSMMPTLNPAGDVVLVEHVTVTLGRLQRGDVIVAKSPTDPNAVVCKRILGLPGDTIPKDPRYPYFRGVDKDIVVQLLPGRHVIRGGPLSLQVTLPDGKTVSLSALPSDTVKALKEKLSALASLAPNKQKLKHDLHGFLKDAQTVAGYGLTAGDKIVLESKTRGGR